jgi:hypothetical protein
MSLRAIIESADIKENQYTINIYLNGFTGNPTIYPGQPEFLKLSWGNQSSDELPHFYGCKATINFKAENNYELTDLYVSSSRGVEVEVLQGTTPVFYGFMEHEDYNEPYQHPPYDVGLVAYDGLYLLENETLVDEFGEHLTGQYTPRELLTIILQKTGLNLKYNTAVSLRETSSGGGNPLDNYTVDAFNYEGKNCKEILFQLFGYCRVQQRNGEWWVISQDAWAKTTYTSFKYFADGTFISSELINPEITDEWSVSGDGGEIEIKPPVKLREIVQDYRYIDNLVIDGKFGSTYFNDLENWSAVNVEPGVKTYDSDGNNYLYIPAVSVAEQDIYNIYQTNAYVYSSPIPVTETFYNVSVALKYALIASGNTSGQVYFQLKLTGASGTVYWINAEIVDNEKIVYSFAATSTPTPVSVKSNIETWSTGMWWWKETHYALRSEWIEGQSTSEAFGNFDGASLDITGGIPEDGEVEIYLYATNSIYSSKIYGVGFTDVSLNIVEPEGADEFIKQQNIVLLNNAENNYTPDELELINGDLPDMQSNTIVYRGGMLLINGEPTTQWSVDGVTGTYGFAEIVGRLITSLSRLPRMSMSLDYADLLPTIQNVLHDPLSGKKYVESGIDFDAAMHTTTGNYDEILTNDITTLTATTKKTFEKSGNSGGGSGSGNIIVKGKNTDEKVSLINPETFKKVNQPGYLNLDYFRSVVDFDEENPTGDNTGKSVIELMPLLIHENFLRERYLPQGIGDNAVAIGEGTIAATFHEIALGAFNIDRTPADGAPELNTWRLTDILLAIGNGSGNESRSDALRMYKSGLVDLYNAIIIGAYEHGNEGEPAPELIPGLLQYTSENELQFVDESLTWRTIATQQWVTDNFGNDKTYEHDQPTAASSWTITHNLGKNPSVTVVDTAGSVVEGKIEYINKNQVTITFNAAFSGVAYCN